MAVVNIPPAWKLKKTPRFNTTVQESTALQGSVYVANAVYPVWDFEFTIPYVSGRMDDPTSDIANLMGLFIAAKGRAGTFLFTDPYDNSVTNFQFGTGDGTSQVFPLTRPIGSNGALDIVQNLNGSPSIFNNGTLVSPSGGYSIDSRGVVTFNTAPASGHALTWTGSFYFLVRFKQDSLADLEQFFTGSWSINTFELESFLR